VSEERTLRLGTAAEAAAWPGVSVVIATRDRAADLERCLETVAALDYPSWDVVIVDQSEGDLTAAVVARFADAIPELRHERTAERGLSRARNLGLAAATGEIVAFLDDDCTVPADWLWLVAAVFERHPDAGLVFGAVRDGLLDEDTYVPSYVVPVERRLAGALAAVRAHGIGAGMYMRRALAERVGPFDPQLGAGGRFLSSEDWDYTFRALRAGSAVVETPTVAIDHHGGRRYEGGEAARLLRGNAFSHGAMHAKLLRCGQPAALLLAAAELWEDVRLLRLARPTNAGRLVAYVRGVMAGLTTPVDRGRLVYSDT
jgi:GT2 family glycosyltransferase